MANELINHKQTPNPFSSGAVSPGVLPGLAALPSFDHLKYGRVFTHFRYPPKAEGFESFKDCLKEIIPTKIKRITSRMKKLEAEHKQILRKADKSKDKWFAEIYADERFSENKICKKWLNYWLVLWDGVNEVKKPESHEPLNVERAKQYPLEQLYSGPLRQFGGKLNGLCPFHEEKTPSFFIFSDNHYHCFSCGEHGDSIDFCMKSKNLDFKEAVRSLT